MSAGNRGPWSAAWGGAVELAVGVVLTGSALAGSALAAGSAGNLERCAQWRMAQGVDKATLANQLGAANHLTKNQRLAEAQPGETRSLYRTSDLQRLCRTP